MLENLRRARSPRAAVACFIGVGAVGFMAAQAVATPPTLAHVFPAGGQRGATVVVTCKGEFSWPVKVWAPGVEVAVGDEEGKLEISISEDLAADRVWLRLYNDEGASAVAPFLIGGLKEIAEEEPNDSPRTAQAVAEAAVTINGVLEKNGDVDAFAVELSTGQTLVAAVDANRRLGSPMDAILQVVSPAGTVLAENHDDAGLDPRLAYTATQSGTHIVRVFAFPAAPDSRIAFRGGDDYIYRLTLTTGPFITHAAPLTISAEEPGDVEPLGWNIPPCTKLPVVLFGDARCGSPLEIEAPLDVRSWPDDRMGFAFAPGWAGAARIRLAPHAVAAGVVTSDASNPLTLTPPHAVTGCLHAPRQTDVFRIALKKGEHAVISVASQSLDFPLVPVARLTDAAGKVVAQVGDTGPAKDAEITHTAPEDGDYELNVTDRFRHGSERHFYRLTVRSAQADFTLSAAADALVVTPDKPAELKMKVERRAVGEEAIGPITIEALDLPPGVTAPPIISEPDGPTAAEVTLTLSASGQAAFSGPIRIRGTADQPRKIKRFARTSPVHAASFESIWLTAVQK